MKHLFAGLAAVAVIGAAAGAAYMYYKKSQENMEDYEEYIFTDEGDEFADAEDIVITEDVVPQEEIAE
ncbi:MAG: hypothetical protein IKY30_02000 [Oscillospiraceae bacterium]|nr:hypothetical protein [Oscillospiraceae bacterium]